MLFILGSLFCLFCSLLLLEVFLKCLVITGSWFIFRNGSEERIGSSVRLGRTQECDEVGIWHIAGGAFVGFVFFSGAGRLAAHSWLFAASCWPQARVSPECTSVTAGDPALTHHHLRKSTAYLRGHRGVVHSLGWNSWRMTFLHHCGVLQSSFTALRSSVLCLFLPLFPAPDLFTVAVSGLSPLFHLFQNVTGLESYIM